MPANLANEFRDSGVTQMMWNSWAPAERTALLSTLNELNGVRRQREVDEDIRRLQREGDDYTQNEREEQNRITKVVVDPELERKAKYLLGGLLFLAAPRLVQGAVEDAKTTLNFVKTAAQYCRTAFLRRRPPNLEDDRSCNTTISEDVEDVIKTNAEDSEQNLFYNSLT